MLEPTPLYGGNADFLEGLYEQYLRDPASVDARWRGYFERMAPPAAGERLHTQIQADIAARARAPRAPAAAAAPPAVSPDNAAKQAAVSRLIQIWTNRGHLVAKTDPLGLTTRPTTRVLALSYFGLSQADLDTEFFTGSRNGAVPKREKLRDILAQLEFIYAGTIGAEFAHVSDSDERLWLQDQFQAGRLAGKFTTEERRNILWQLTAAEGLERYLHTKYVGQKRFSLEGGDALIPMLDTMIRRAGSDGVKDVVLGMAHRGRLNVLVNLQGKSPSVLFSEFEGVYDLKKLKGSGVVMFFLGFLVVFL